MQKTQQHAARPLVPCATCHRDIPRGALTCIYCGEPTPASRIRRTTRMRRYPGRSTLGVLTMLAGLATLFYPLQFPLNIGIGVTAILLGAGITRGWQCAHCSAKVDRQTVECPRCALPFARF